MFIIFSYSLCLKQNQMDDPVPFEVEVDPYAGVPGVTGDVEYDFGVKYGDDAEILSEKQEFVRLSKTFKPELKYVDVSWDDQPVYQGPGAGDIYGQTFVLNGLKKGSDSFNRVGKQVQLKSLKLRFALKIAVSYGITTTVSSDVLRFMVVIDHNAPSYVVGPPYQPNLFNVCKGIDYLGNLSSNVAIFDDPSQRGRFEILADKICIVSPNGAAYNLSGDRVFWEWDLSSEVMDRIIKYNGNNAGDITDFIDGAIYLYTYATNSAIEWNQSFKCRVGFVDV